MNLEEQLITRFELQNLGLNNKIFRELYAYYYYFENLEIWRGTIIKHGKYTKIKYTMEELGATGNEDNTIRTGTITAEGISYGTGYP